MVSVIDDGQLTDKEARAEVAVAQPAALEVPGVISGGDPYAVGTDL